MINPQWLEQPISRTKFYGPKAVRAIEVRLYLGFCANIATKCKYRILVRESLWDGYKVQVSTEDQTMFVQFQVYKTLLIRNITRLRRMYV